MVQKWTLCIEVSCHSNPGQVVIPYILHNQALNHVLQNKRVVSRRTTNNETYYISLVEGLKVAKKHGANNIAVVTNSELISNQINGAYKVQKDNLKHLHREAKTITKQFQTFTIDYQVEVKRMSTDLVSRAVSIVMSDVQDDFSSTSIPERVVHGNQYISPICGCFLLIIVVMSLMSWFYRGS